MELIISAYTSFSVLHPYSRTPRTGCTVVKDPDSSDKNLATCVSAETVTSV